ncbi:hypothetical protein P152DRAFT_461177 [Eremomyces bilateralis CBS 781.70]|uniref:Uncharacterized protein n=1 Tax=Eremomyces bilateralis CBS 781.70 TaxID=1392243 RepID=A0A6G1FVU5_9PEZI|nr:uncharacterized protein P152DRAFT_461177 [Eremomyces bilateralis CBS 781.70]KAF1809791.1 hypothetical protein P152DRAFT_461177 [Eremomyces bilateralis CBS 781.70]
MSGPSASPAHRAHSNRVNNNSSSSSSKSSNRDNTSLATPVSKRAAHAQSVPYTRRTTRSLATKPGASPLQELKDTHTQRKPRTAKSISVEPDASQENANRANGVLVKAAESPPHEASPTPSERPTTRFAQQQLLRKAFPNRHKSLEPLSEPLSSPQTPNTPSSILHGTFFSSPSVVANSGNSPQSPSVVANNINITPIQQSDSPTPNKRNNVNSPESTEKSAHKILPY